MVHQWVHIHVPRRSHVNVETCSDAEYNEDYYGVEAVSDYRAFAQTEVPYLSLQIKILVTLVIVITYLLFKVWHAKTRSFTHLLETATASVHRVFSQEEDYRKDDEREQSED